jgi:hypothetical protein
VCLGMCVSMLVCVCVCVCVRVRAFCDVTGPMLKESKTVQANLPPSRWITTFSRRNRFATNASFFIAVVVQNVQHLLRFFAGLVVRVYDLHGPLAQFSPCADGWYKDVESNQDASVILSRMSVQVYSEGAM